MSKKSRLFVVLVVLAICFAFLWPSISWYANTPKDAQDLALSSLEYIKDYSKTKANADVQALIDAVNENPNAELTADQEWLAKAAKDNFKAMKKAVPSPLTLAAALDSFATKDELVAVAETRYRTPILKDKKHYQNSVKRGLDLSGGMSVIVKADLDSVLANYEGTDDAETVKRDAMAQAIETLSGRIDRFGLSSPTIRQQGEDRIYIELPGSAEADQINSIIQGRGILNFREANMEATNEFASYYAAVGPAAFDSQGRLVDSSIIPEGYEVLGRYVTDKYGLDERVGYIVVKSEPILDGKHIKSAQLGTDQYSRPTVNFTLDSEGADIFGDYTREHVGSYLAIVSDGKVKSNAEINEAITTGQVQISGFGQQEAVNLRKVLQTAWLDVPLDVESQQIIGASLGEQAIRQGFFAIIVGLALIIVFMIIWYKGAGIHAFVAQVLNLYIMFSILSALNLTVTLPMIAGMILTIGMAVDANVIIFERIKEELALGKDRAAAVEAGFSNAFWAIMDSNITTFIAAIFMSQLGSGAIQGFAYSLAIGVVSTLFTALFVSRLIFDFWTEACHKKTVSISWRKN